MIKQAILSITGVTCLVLALGAQADPFPPYWENGNGAAVHFPPVAWPDEPANPLSCEDECGEWKPYTRFQQSINDPRTRDPSNVSLECADLDPEENRYLGLSLCCC